MDRQRGGWLFAALAALAAGVALAAGLATGSGEIAQAQPGLPGTFFGEVTAADGDVDGGLDVVAYIDGTVCSETDTEQTIREGGVTKYLVVVLSEEGKAGCGVAAAEDGTGASEVHFKIGDRFAEETGSWDARPQTLHLTPVSYTHLTLPTKRIV